MTEYRIFPPIGIARLGEDDDFFVGPEVPGHGSGNLQPDGSTTPITRYKDASARRIRKQGARFHLFESADGVTWIPADLPTSATVTWTVTLVNKKSAVARPSAPPTVPTRPIVPAENQGLVIDGGTEQVSGANAVSSPLVGTFHTTAPNGTPYQVDVELGRLRTDSLGRLVVLGGAGFSSAPPGTSLGGSFYRNPRWHDDVADGPVNAEIRLSEDSEPMQVEGGAWVLIGPPDYAPGIDCVVTMYDVLRQVGNLPVPATPSYDRDIAPLVRRVRRLQWVHSDQTWSDVRLSRPELRSREPAQRPLRLSVRNIILHTETVFEGHVSAAGPPFRLRAFQRAMLDSWVDGNFDDTPVPASAQISADGLTRAALDAAAGQGFCPGIEAGIIFLDPTLYAAPFDFRIDHTTVQAGDLTALMAQPWQADFLKCNTEWWPSQRPDLAPQADGSVLDWIRGAGQHSLLVQRSGRLGLVVQQGASEVFVEAERDATLPG
jgi:hypothetical protein